MTQRSIRVTFVQPALAKYRIPVFRELARRPKIDLTVIYGAVAGLDNVPADGFKAIPSRRWDPVIAGQQFMIQADEWRYCTRSKADVVVLRWTARSLSLLVALFRARMNRVPVVLWGHGYSKSERSWWPSVRKWIARQASAIVFYDHSTRDVYLRDGFDPQMLFVAINSIDHTEIDAAQDYWNNRPIELAAFRQLHELERGPVILFVSRLQPANRIDLLVRATAELVREMPSLKTVIIGNGSAEKYRLDKLAGELAISENVIFSDGIYDESKLAPWFMSANVFCYPANIGLSILHAFWYGLPVVTSDNVRSQNPEIVALRNGVNGLLFRDGDVDSLTEVLRTALSGTNHMSTMSKAARQTVEDRFTIPKMVDGLEDAIEFASQLGSSD